MSGFAYYVYYTWMDVYYRFTDKIIYTARLTMPTYSCVYTNMHIICSIEKHVSSITLKDVRLENVSGQAVRVWNTDPEKHNVIWLERMSVKNVGYKTKSKSALQLQLKSAYALIRNCFFNNVTAADSDVISVSFDSETTSRVSTAKVTQNSFLFCSKGGVIYVNNTGENNATLTVTKNNLRHNSAHESRSLVQFVNMTVAMEGNLLYNNSAKYMLEVGSDSERNLPSVRADGNIFWFNVGLKHAAQYTVSVKATNVTFRGNILNNPANTYELSTREMDDVEANDANIDFANNWWGSGLGEVVKSRIRDGRSVRNLPTVISSPFEVDPPSGLHFSSKISIDLLHKVVSYMYLCIVSRL